MSKTVGKGERPTVCTVMPQLGTDCDRYLGGAMSRVQLSIGLEGEGNWPMEEGHLADRPGLSPTPLQPTT